MLWLHEYVSPYLQAGFGLSPVEIKEKKGDIDTVGLSENNFSVSQGKNLEKKIYRERKTRGRKTTRKTTEQLKIHFVTFCAQYNNNIPHHRQVI